MSLIACHRIILRIAKDKSQIVLDMIEQVTAPDSIAVGELAEGKMLEKNIENIELLYQNKPDQDQIENIFKICEVTPTYYHMDVLQDQDWVTASLRELPPVVAGRFCVHGSHCKEEIPKGLINIEVDAGLAFGTGHHETTEACLLALSHLAKFHRPQKIADIGTGTGILAMAAHKLWRKKIIATDIDKVAVTVTRSNIRKNKMAPMILTSRASGTSDMLIQKHKYYDLLIANILSRPLIAMAGDFRKIMSDNGYIILSGLLWRQRHEVYHAYRAHGFRKHKIIRLGDWGCLLLRKKSCYLIPKALNNF